jgi:choline kinase
MSPRQPSLAYWEEVGRLLARVAVVLAAGFGSRLGGVAKALVRVDGRFLGWYPLSVLHALGVSEVCIVTRREVVDGVAGLARQVYGRGGVNVVLNLEPERENGFSLMLAVRECGLDGGEFIVSMVDHIYSPLIPSRVSSARASGVYVVGGDASPCCVDVGEATLVEAVNCLGFRVGKGLASWTHVDVGVHFYSRVRLETLYATAAGLSVVKLNHIVDSLASRGLLRVADVSGLPWTEVDTPQDLEEVRRGSRRWVVEHVEEWLRS